MKDKKQIKVGPLRIAVEANTAVSLTLGKLEVTMQDFLLQAVIERGDATKEGVLIEAVALAWFDIAREIEKDPSFLNQFANHYRKFEEFMAACYKKAGGYEDVILTPSSGDLGIDIILSATLPGAGRIHIVDQCKAFKLGNAVAAKDVRELAGVLYRDTHNIHKGIITTTSTFAPGVPTEFAELIPDKLILRDGTQLRDWVSELLKN